MLLLCCIFCTTSLSPSALSSVFACITYILTPPVLLLTVVVNVLQGGHSANISISMYVLWYGTLTSLAVACWRTTFGAVGRLKLCTDGCDTSSDDIIAACDTSTLVYGS